MNPEIVYDPPTLLFYEMLVNDQKRCSKEYFDSCLEEICERFMAIPDREIQALLNALGNIYPAMLVNYFERYIGEIKKFCQE